MDTKENIIDKLIGNSKAAMFAAIELHNKPIFQYRYEVSIILIINSWELLLKAYLIKYRSDLKVIKNDRSTMDFKLCIENTLSTLGKQFMTTSENLYRLYDFRCNFIHFYDDGIDNIVFLLLSKNVMLYNTFLVSYFANSISEETNLVLLPIGFKKPLSPVDFLSNETDYKKSSESVQNFIKDLVKSTTFLHGEDIEDSILINYTMSVQNESRINNADLVAAIVKGSETATIRVEKNISEFKITNDDRATKIKIDEESIFKNVFSETYKDIVDYCHRVFSDFKTNNAFHKIMKEARLDPNLHKRRLLNIKRESGSGQSFYSHAIYEYLNKFYKKK